jgi:ribosomal protein S18 acetylase RimI-like enzyme
MRLRPPTADEDDAVVALLYETAGGMYDLFAGGRAPALRVLRAAYARDGNSASREVVTVAELDGRVAGALSAFPVTEGGARARAFLRLTLVRTAPWHWPRTLRIFRLGGRLTPPAPVDALYVDALATDPACRRRGIATALLRAAEDRARAAGLNAVALDTADHNVAAQALYEDFGMERSGSSRPAGQIPGAIAYVKRV